MRLIDAEEATRLYGRMGPGREISGGSAGNTAAGVAMLGGRAGFVGQVADDQLGEVYRHDIQLDRGRVHHPGAAAVGGADRALPGPGHARRPADDEHLPRRRPESRAARRSTRTSCRAPKILYLEGYLWDPEVPRAAMERAIDIAREAGGKVAFTLSDSFCIERHRDSFNALIDSGRLDILFANEAEIVSLTGETELRRGGGGGGGAGAGAGRHPKREGRGRGRRRRAGRGAGRAGRDGSSTRPAPAICSRPAS